MKILFINYINRVQYSGGSKRLSNNIGMSRKNFFFFSFFYYKSIVLSEEKGQIGVPLNLNFFILYLFTPKGSLVICQSVLRFSYKRIHGPLLLVGRERFFSVRVTKSFRT